jgi:hypothetical protein
LFKPQSDFLVASDVTYSKTVARGSNVSYMVTVRREAGDPGKTFPRQGIHTEISPLRSPGFPVETRGFDDLHAALFTESRTRGRR